MRKIIVSTILTILSVGCFAQDIIVKKDGSVIQARVADIGTSDVKYKKWTNLEGPSYTIAKSDILAITYQNGEKEMFEIGSKTNKNSTSFAAKDEAENNRLINSFNNSTISLAPSLLKKSSNVDIAAVTFGIDPSVSEVANADLSISYEFKMMGGAGGGISGTLSSMLYDHTTDKSSKVITCLHNRTNKTIFVDLANTFVIKCNNESEAYYVPKSTTTAHGTENGVAVNMGAVAGALGVDGALGTLANGITVGHSSNDTHSTTIHSQRIISIPPMSTRKLEPHEIGTDNFLCLRESFNYNREANINNPSAEKLYLNKPLHWEPQDSPTHFGFHLTYGYDENFEQAATMQTRLYLKDVVGVPSKFTVWANMNKIIKDKDAIFLIARYNK